MVKRFAFIAFFVLIPSVYAGELPVNTDYYFGKTKELQCVSLIEKSELTFFMTCENVSNKPVTIATILDSIRVVTYSEKEYKVNPDNISSAKSKDGFFKGGTLNPSQKESLAMFRIKDKALQDIFLKRNIKYVVFKCFGKSDVVMRFVENATA